MAIEKNVPIPKKQPGVVSNFAQYEKGDSEFFANEPNVAKAYNAAYAHGKKHNKKFTRRKVEGGYRIWRVE